MSGVNMKHFDHLIIDNTYHALTKVINSALRASSLF